jgi:hydrogenase maturation protein HypF
MAGFVMCAACRREYDDPTDRRFHAQPNACPACGPRLALRFFDGRPDLADWPAIRDEVWRLLEAGGTIAIKGIGGYHLACLATDEPAVRRLRARKRRPDKPLAVMAGTLGVLRRHCVVSPAEAAALGSPRAPIVLLRPRAEGRIAPSVAPSQHRIGAMLPYSPLHHLLFDDRDDVLVMTSGNLTDQPQVIDDGEALRLFAGIADAVLLHDRPIAVRVDDSVVRVDGARVTHLRLGRGWAPLRLLAPKGLERGQVLALGGQLKSTFCLKRGERLVLSQHIGDLEEPANLDAFEASLAQYRRLYDLRPEAVAVDLHPLIKSR